MQQQFRIAVAGGGSWGTALAHLLARNGHEVCLLMRDTALAAHINTHHENPRYLKECVLDVGVRASVLPQDLRERDIIVLAIPCQQLRGWLQAHLSFLSPDTVFVNAAKGLETQSQSTCSKILAETLPWGAARYAMLSGPSFAREVVEEKPTAVVIGCVNPALGQSLRTLFSNSRFRSYSSVDLVGVEMGGALKNVMAIATGICDGLSFGDNARAALMTRGLAEICRLGMACGGELATFMGLSGLGDLLLTCTGELSRNRQLGLRLGRGEKLEAITASLGMVAEGVKTTEAAYALASQLAQESPLISSVYAILYDNKEPQVVVRELMTRTLKDEIV